MSGNLTFAQARDEITQMLATAWAVTGYPLLFEDMKGDPPKTGGPWARLRIAHNRGDQEALANPIGTRLWKRDGLLFVQVFTPIGEGLSRADALAKIAMDAYEGKSSPGGVWFRKVRYREIGPDGNWFQVHVIAEFEYTEAK